MNITTSKCEPNPDVAGIGVVVAIVTSACVALLSSTICCILASFQRDKAKNDEADEEDGKTGVHLHVRQFAWYQYALHPSQAVAAKIHNEAFWKAVDLWRRVFDTLLMGMGLNQLITGLALLICAWHKFGLGSLDSHAVLAYTTSMLSAFSYAKVPPLPDKPHVKSQLFRSLVLLVYLILYIVRIAAWEHNGGADVLWVSFGAYTILAICQLLQAWLWWREFRKPSASKPENYLSGLGLDFSSSLIATILALYSTLSLKFGAQNQWSECNLNSSSKNEWTFGQVLAVVLLAAPVLPGVDAYFEERAASEKEQTDAHELVPLTDPQDEVKSARSSTAGTARSESHAPDVAVIDRGDAEGGEMPPPIRRTTTRLESQD
ncbi:pre-rRNA-processing protein esf1 [Friedmanniomyces endolithicus]|uniref:Pre-rRNA-processing protein esf1 n=2 Tax=Dothideomycetidae TaxID=451867 RepID=A0AAN6JVJ5_9PEZI|nr:pre-rRNA-processing protein esf1 [Friedmanniomyces endolithicus]KAK5141982.1 pre-rRNA-processing protein esf1 [Rachicladosporium monterosium]KAK0845690.1 pre-rRNA-processing protein esf1 [Friedmanniomyces endolithicus]KAK0859629.1 pre-rRNA-processing protein esf1 [Friedmanniomyces endolithicus]KAK0877707.1 pre-rRNA-processing protein esf1 [Friedmanniomyces endolithicus]